MSNNIFCKIDKEFCDIIYDIAKDRIVVDCGAGRGLFGELYLENTKGKCLSIDLEIPNEPLSKIIESDLDEYNESILKYFNKPLSDPFKKEINENE